MNKKRLLLFISDSDFSQDSVNKYISENYINFDIVVSDKWHLKHYDHINDNYVNDRALLVITGKLENQKKNDLIMFLYNQLFVYIFNFVKLLFKKKPNIVIVNGYILPIFSGIYCSIFKCKSYYVCADWFVGLNKNEDHWLSKISNNKIFPLLDRLSCFFSSGVINYHELIGEKRREYHGKEIAKESYVYQFTLVKKYTIHNANKYVIFIGNVRYDSGLDIIINAIHGYNESCHRNIKLRIIGRENEAVKLLMDYVNQRSLNSCVEFMGYQPREDFSKLFKDVFCGVNLITSKNSYTTYTLPGKVFDYIQYGIPILASKNIGTVAQIIKENRIGVISDIDYKSLIGSIDMLDKNFSELSYNIDEYITHKKFNKDKYPI